MDKKTVDELYQKIRIYLDTGYNWNDGSEMINLSNILADFFLLIDGNTDAIYDAKIIDEAVGLELDNIGDQINQPRYGATDDNYRFILKSKIVAGHSSGTINDIINTIANSLGISSTGNGIIVKNDYGWDGTKMSGEPQVIDVTGLPTQLISGSSSLQTMMDRLQSATMAGIVIKSINFVNGTTMNEYDGIGIFKSKSQTITVLGGN
ncbi:hypothetical protein [Lentilactobacillus hilgardii]|uniref:hypothetical protein n=1 Tax=Lentilactobacillus hilgardii TaxID=1588 RepID=UPI0021C444AF|nr:hypothetical protein [Lentilactobacillus hilgardii]MCP9334147.1 hypothetical protein [Lentilactobacillus hilgardii]MCP9350760.1 hypothetical protein [Lentilactobacillus hilgardii]MCP9352623.1 hypothetical protein [Lentilactobacillus hilgardii]